MVSNLLTVFRVLKNEMGVMAEGSTRNVATLPEAKLGIRKSVTYGTHYHFLQLEVVYFLDHSNGNQEGIVGRCLTLNKVDLRQ